MNKLLDIALYKKDRETTASNNENIGISETTLNSIDTIQPHDLDDQHFDLDVLLSFLNVNTSEDDLHELNKILAKKQYEFESVNNRLNVFFSQRYRHDYFEQEYNDIVEEKGSPIHANIDVQNASVDVPDTWDELTVSLGGQLITLSPSVTIQDYFDMGFEVVPIRVVYDWFTAVGEIDLEDMIGPGEWGPSFQVENDETGAILGLKVLNTSSEKACELKDCTIGYIEIRQNPTDENIKHEQAELILPTPEEFIQSLNEEAEENVARTGKGNQSFKEYATWDNLHDGTYENDYFDIMEFEHNTSLYDFEKYVGEAKIVFNYHDYDKLDRIIMEMDR